MALFDVFDHRDRDLRAEATRRGLKSSENDPFGCGRAPFMLLHRGATQKVKTVLWRAADPHAVRVFDFRYFTDTKTDTVPSPLFTCGTALANAAWPYLAISPAPGKLGFTVHFDEHHDFDMLDPAFAETFTVRTADDQFATALLDAEMRYFLQDHARALDVVFNGAWVMASAEHVPVELVPNLFGFLDDLLTHVPKVVSELYPPPLEGDIHTPMPDPGLLSKAWRTQADELLDMYDRHGTDSADRLVSSVLGFNREVPGFGTRFTPQDIADAAIDADILDEQAWTETTSPLRALADQIRPSAEYDLDGQRIEPQRQNPWGKGRPLPHESN